VPAAPGKECAGRIEMRRAANARGNPHEGGGAVCRPMRSRLAAVALVLLAGLAGCAGKAADAVDAASPPGTVALRGVVVDDAIRPVAGARIGVDGAPANATTGADGLFEVPGLEPGAHVVRAAKAGYADAVTQVDLRLGAAPEAVKLVLVADASSLAYAEVQKIDGYVECGTDTFNSHFAACGSGNVGSFIACAQAGVCQGNVSADRYIVIQRFDRTPTFLVVEVAWEATQSLGTSLSVWLGSATKEQLKFYPETPDVWNTTDGPSPLYGTMNGTMLADSGIGDDSWFLAQVFAGNAGQTGPAAVGVVLQQRFEMFLTSFYGYEPPAEWRFAVDGKPPEPPA
jgi:hypothetical protein